MDIGTIGEQYHSTKNLIYLDWNNNGPDYLDQFFDETKVVLSEVFTRDGSGIDAGEIPFYEGWDYLVVSFCGNQLKEVKCVVAEIGIPDDKDFAGTAEVMEPVVPSEPVCCQPAVGVASTTS